MQSSASVNIIRPPSNNMETLLSAGKAVETVIMRDEAYPDLGDVLTGKQNKITFSIHATKYRVIICYRWNF